MSLLLPPARRTLVVLLLSCLCLVPPPLRAAGLDLQTNDVIALVGGAGLVTLAQDGSWETALVVGRPRLHLRFRSFAWEGDTVFAQPREVNYPDLAAQLREFKVTVVLGQFGQMESLAGPAGVTNFITAYGRLLDRFAAVTGRFVLLMPARFEPGPALDAARAEERNAVLAVYASAVRELARQRGAAVMEAPASANGATRGEREEVRLLRAAIAAKNRVWFRMVRPTNWAFLAGDRTDQLFSRDPHDRNLRAFAGEMRQFGPLLAGAEQRIDELAAQAAAAEATR